MLCLALISINISAKDSALLKGLEGGYLIASYKELQSNTVELALDDKFNKDPKTAIELLSSYYTNLINQRYDNLKLLITKEDGSVDYFNENITSFKEQYENFNRVEKIYLTKVVQWGDYRVVDLLFRGSGRSLKWREFVYCTQANCSFSYYSHVNGSKDMEALNIILASEEKVSFSLKKRSFQTNFNPVRVAKLDSSISLQALFVEESKYYKDVNSFITEFVELVKRADYKSDTEFLENNNHLFLSESNVFGIRWNSYSNQFSDEGKVEEAQLVTNRTFTLKALLGFVYNSKNIKVSGIINSASGLLYCLIQSEHGSGELVNNIIVLSKTNDGLKLVNDAVNDPFLNVIYHSKLLIK